jgi:hypothetical protein
MPGELETLLNRVLAEGFQRYTRSRLLSADLA